MLGVAGSSLKWSNCSQQHPTTCRNTSQQGGQTHAACCAQQCFDVLNSPFFPPHIGAEPGRAKEESWIICMCMLRTPPFFPPKSGEKPYLEVLSRFGLLRDFLNDNIQATISALLEIKQLLCVQSLILYYIKQMDSMLLCICPVIDHR